MLEWNRKRVAIKEESAKHSDEGGVSERQRTHHRCLVHTATNITMEPLKESNIHRYEEVLVQGSAPGIPPLVEVDIGEQVTSGLQTQIQGKP